jgi:hypothetical protein
MKDVRSYISDKCLSIICVKISLVNTTDVLIWDGFFSPNITKTYDNINFIDLVKLCNNE